MTSQKRIALLTVHPYVIGALVGTILGTVFVLVNRQVLPGGWQLAALFAWAVALIPIIVLVLLRPVPELPGPRRSSLLVYGASVLAMLALFPVSRFLLASWGHVELLPAAIAMAVGLHFIPFAWAFRARIYLILGLAMTVIGAAGLVIGALGGGAMAAGAAAVLAGLVMMASVALGGLRRSGNARE